MSLDLRIPLGLLFSLVGVLLTIYGAVTHGSSIYDRSAGMNINLIWGVAMLAFGLMMLLLGLRGSRHAQPVAHEPAERPHIPGH